MELVIFTSSPKTWRGLLTDTRVLSKVQLLDRDLNCGFDNELL